MNEYQKNNTSKNNGTNYSNNFSKKSKNKNKRIKFQLFDCMKRCFNKIIKQLNDFHSKFSLTFQILLISIPLSFFLYIIIFVANYFGYERMFKFDFYNTLKNEYLKYLIKDIDDIHIDVGISEIKTQFEDIDNLFFFQLYFKELISMGLLDEEPPVKIFPKISLNSDQEYKVFESLQNENKANNIYTMPKKESEKHIDERHDQLSEIGKVYYYMLPLVGYESFLKKTYINETFLIAYEFDKNDKNKNVVGEEFYFSFPKLKTHLDMTNNFIPTNNFLSPQIVKNKTNFSQIKNNSYYEDNWFIKQDYEFRENANNLNNSKLSFANLNYNYFGKLNRSNIFSLQNYFQANGKSYIINIILFINKKELKDGNLDHSIFFFFNDSMKINEKEKYSDNNTYTIFKSNIQELGLSTKLNEFFYYGMHDINNSFFKWGVSFDSFDIQKLGEPALYYISNEKITIDLRYFSNIYLFTLLFHNLKFEEIKEEYKDIIQYQFEKNETILRNICNKFNFSLYIKYLKKENINCWDHKTLLYYSEEIIKENIVFSEYLGKPNCVCLPLFCLKNSNKDTNLDEIEYIENITLPSECQNIYNAYLNSIEEEFKSHTPEYDPILKIDYKLNNLELFSNDIKDILEEEYFLFKNVKLDKLNGITLIIATTVDNIGLKSLISLFITFIDEIKAYYLLIILLGIFLAFLISNAFLYINIKKISDVIFDYKKIHENFLSQLEAISSTESKKEEIKNKEINKLEIERKKTKNFENNALIKIDKESGKRDIKHILFSNENTLLEELLKLFFKYYNIPKMQLIKMNRETISQLYFEEGNELFEFLKNISIYIPKFKLEVTFDYNFFNNAKLNQSFLKSIPKNVKLNNQQVILTQSVIFELLSTENIEDCGLITNLYFKYVTNINLFSKVDKNCIKNALFECLFPGETNIGENKDNIINDKSLIEDNNRIMKIIRREENKTLDELENNFENDDYIKKEKLLPYFDSFLVNVYYKYLRKLSLKN